MSLLSWNCRGSGGSSTIPILRRYLRSTGAAIAFISETKCSAVKARRRIARLPLTNAEIVPSRGRGGGLWLLWADEISVTILQSSLNFIVAKIKIGPMAQPWLLFAVYGDCNDRKNDEIWNTLSRYVIDSGLPVCAIGDFNCITDIQEKEGGSEVLKAKHKKFRSFLQVAGLVDLGHNGPAYTWANNQQGRSLILERLDRGVAMAEWIALFPNTKIFHLPNYSSDHLPILLRTEPQPRRKPKSFRVEHWWFQQHDFDQVCLRAVQNQEQTWEETCSGLRREVRQWNQGSKDPNRELSKIEAEMKELLVQPQSPQIRDRIALLQSQYQTYSAAQEVFWLQRSRLQWDLMGDLNTRFFQTTAMVRRRRNRIETIQKENGEWLVKEEEVRREFVRHFKEIYSATPQSSQSAIDHIKESIRGLTVTLPQEAGSGLEAAPTVEEIIWAVNALGPTKSPGPDGITAGLVQQHWSIFGPIVISEVQLFFSSGVMKPHIAHSNLVLIPKIDAPTKVNDFRPISVCNVVYKVISKILAKRMQPFMSTIISTAQTAFIPGREISENVLLLREIIHSFKKPTTEDQQFVLKADLAKAFDRLSWDYLFQLLPEYGFPQKFCTWVEACVRSAKFTILFNGNGDGFFLPKRGL